MGHQRAGVVVDAEIANAFLSVNQGFSGDRVLVDPELNSAFLARCRELHIKEDDRSINWRLLNLRKKGKLPRSGRTKGTTFPNEPEYRFASEIASRVLERRQDRTLDWIFCDPVLAKEFDQLAAEICPGFTPLQYRWAALNLRKTQKLPPELMGRVVPSKDVLHFPMDQIVAADLPTGQGLYIFYDATQTLYVGEASSLRSRLKKHFDHSDNKGLARWLWEKGTAGVFVEFHLLPEGTSQRVRRALETELIRSRRPLFNVQR